MIRFLMGKSSRSLKSSRKLTIKFNNVLTEKKENAKEKIKVDYDYLSLKAKQYGVSTETKERIERYYPDIIKPSRRHLLIFIK